MFRDLSFGFIDLGGEKDSALYKGGQGASYVPWNPLSALKSLATGALKLGAKAFGKDAAQEGAETVVKKNADDAAGAGGRSGDDAADAGRRPADPPPRQLVTTPRGTTFDIPGGWTSRTTDNGKGIVYQRPGATRDADSIRIMEPTPRYPDGYFVYYNRHGQPLDVHGKPGPPNDTHIPEKHIGRIPEWPTP